MRRQQRLLAIESPAPYVTASSWIIVEAKTGEILFGKNENESRQVASLTKIMTAHIVIKLLARFNISEHAPTITVLRSSTKLLGTSADLVSHDTLSTWELLHGMMLPSGNDAAQSLAVHFGLLLLKDRCRYLQHDDPFVS